MEPARVNLRGPIGRLGWTAVGLSGRSRGCRCGVPIVCFGFRLPPVTTKRQRLTYCVDGAVGACPAWREMVMTNEVETSMGKSDYTERGASGGRIITPAHRDPCCSHCIASLSRNPRISPPPTPLTSTAAARASSSPGLSRFLPPCPSSPHSSFWPRSTSTTTREFRSYGSSAPLPAGAGTVPRPCSPFRCCSIGRRFG